MTSNTAQLNELIQITRDGQRFYEHAHEAVKDVRLQAVFLDMSRVKTEVIQALAVKVTASHETPATGGTLMGKLRQAYADTRALLSSEEEATYVAQLEDAEDRILHAFEDAMECADADAKALLSVEMPKVRACFERMHALKQSMQ